MKGCCPANTKCYALYQQLLKYGQDFSALIVRLYIAKIFLQSSLDKIAYWPGTIVTFKYQYDVPLISPILAAYIGTSMEFILPTLLILGLGARLTPLVFFGYNLFCVFSFPFLWTAAGNAGLHDHINWGLLLMMLTTFGMGRLTLDHILCRVMKKHCHK